MSRFFFIVSLWAVMLAPVPCFAAETATSFQFPLSDYIVSGYAFGQIVGGLAHVGEDAHAVPGTPVLAAANGHILSFSGEIPGYGHGVIIEHTMPDGSVIFTVEGHLGSADLRTSGDVQKGDVIGYIGTSAENGGWDPHLHFGVYTGPYDGLWVFYGYRPTTAGWADPTSFIESREQICDVTVETVYAQEPVTGRLIVTDPDGENFDLHEYYDGGDGYVLLNRGDMGSQYANPIVDNEGSTDNKERWLSDDVDGNDWDDIVLITHVDASTVKAHVWLANGDGTLQSRDKWLEFTGQADLYFLDDRDADGDADLIFATQNGSGVVQWKYCSSDGIAFTGCGTWTSDFGNSVTDDVYLVGDVTGDGRTDVVRGYNSSSTTQACVTGGNKMRWRVLRGGSTDVEVWKQDWGCSGSEYLLDNVDGDPQARRDLIQIRFDDSTTGHVFVSSSTGSSFGSASTWKDDLGSPSHRYFTSDTDDDGIADLISYLDDSDDRIYVARSTGSSFMAKELLAEGVDKETSGAFRFGRFGDIYLAVGEQQVVDCAAQAAAYGMASVDDAFYLTCEGWEYAEEGLQMQTCDDSWLPGDAEWLYFWDCGFEGDWFGMSAGSFLTQAQCEQVQSEIVTAVEDEMILWWQYADGSVAHSLQVMTPVTTDEDGRCFFSITP
ncbi:MAG: M23 family metallopeptidase [Candidatus Kerfeldbacteria bacterium]